MRRIVALVNASTRVALYYRVRTATQATENQRHDPEQVAAAPAWNIVAQLNDAGISGARARSDYRRPADRRHSSPASARARTSCPASSRPEAAPSSRTAMRSEEHT